MSEKFDGFENDVWIQEKPTYFLWPKQVTDREVGEYLWDGNTSEISDLTAKLQDNTQLKEEDNDAERLNKYAELKNKKSEMFLSTKLVETWLEQLIELYDKEVVCSAIFEITNKWSSPESILDIYKNFESKRSKRQQWYKRMLDIVEKEEIEFNKKIRDAKWNEFDLEEKRFPYLNPDFRATKFNIETIYDPGMIWSLSQKRKNNLSFGQPKPVHTRESMTKGLKWYEWKLHEYAYDNMKEFEKEKQEFIEKTNKILDGLNEEIDNNKTIIWGLDTEKQMEIHDRIKDFANKDKNIAREMETKVRELIDKKYDERWQKYVTAMKELEEKINVMKAQISDL